MSGNANYTIQPGGDYRAMAMEVKASNSYLAAQARLNSLMALMLDAGTRVNKAQFKNGTKILDPLLFDPVSAMTEANYGVADSAQVPTAFPDYLVIDGVTMAEWDQTYTSKAYVVTPTEIMLQQSPGAMDIEEAKLMAVMIKDAKIVDDMLLGTGTASRTHMQGLGAVMSQSNTVGGISQATNTWWQPGTHSLSGGAFTDDDMYKAHDAANQVTNQLGVPAAIDAWLLSNYAGGFSVYNKARSYIDAAQRIVDARFVQKWGIDHFVWNGAKCFQNTKVAGKAWGVCSQYLHWDGDTKPRVVRGRIIGGEAQEVVVAAWRTVHYSHLAPFYYIDGATS